MIHTIYRTTAVTSVALATSLIAHASDPVATYKVPLTFCQSAEQITIQTRGCADNARYVQAARDCYSQLQSLRNSVSAVAMSKFSRTNGAQAADYSTAMQNYQATSEAWAYMTSMAGLALTELSAYPDQVHIPDEFFLTQVAGNNPVAWAMTQDCYGSTQKAVDQVIAAVQAELEEFKAKKLAADQAATASSGLDAGVNSLSSGVSGKKLGTSAPARTPAAVSGHSHNGASTITGEIHDPKLDSSSP